MIRLVSVFGLAFLTLAAVAVVTASRKQNEGPAQPDALAPGRTIRPRLYPAAVPSYYAQFSLN